MQPFFSLPGEAAAEQLGPSCRFYPLDTSDPEAILRFSATLHQELPGQQIELLVRLQQLIWISDTEA